MIRFNGSLSFMFSIIDIDAHQLKLQVGDPRDFKENSFEGKGVLEVVKKERAARKVVCIAFLLEKDFRG